MSTLTAPAVPLRPLVDQLGRAEAWRLVRHPLVLIGLALSLAEVVAAALTSPQDAGDLRFIFLSGSAHWPLAVGAFLAANLLALRSHRHGTAELEDTTVTSSARRATALLAATGVLLLLGALLVLVELVVLDAWDGVPVRLPDGFVERPMHPVELLQGPLVVLVMSVLGIALGRWLPTRALGPLMLVPAVLGFFHSTWRFDGLAWRFSPLMAHEDAVGWVQVTPTSGYSVLAGFDVAALSWHLVYVIGLVILLAAASVARTHRSRTLAGVAGVGAVVTLAGAVLQVA